MTTASQNGQKVSTVFVVDDDPEVRLALEQLALSVRLNVKCFESAEVFLSDYENQPGCLVTDVRMPQMNGLDLQRQLVDKGSRIPIIIITAYGEVSMAVEAMQMGAFDFIQKPFSPQLLLQKIQRAIELDTSARDQQSHYSDIVEKLLSLTPREREVLDLLVDGKSTKEIATSLDISLTTVDFHRHNILEKMCVDNVVQLARLYDFYDFAS